MDIENHLFLRQDIERLGIAPLTSMFWYAEYGREKIADWRPEVHDSDGLAIWNGAGERIWRPLNNPTRIFHTSYLDQTPKGFGLIQRDRVFDHYLDGVGYDRRPSTWVEPMGDWGKGMVQLVEIPTDDEIHDNIAAYWLADRPTRAGDAFNYHYRLHWVKDQPFFPGPELAQSWRRAWAAAASPASRGRAASTSSRSSSWAARSPTCPSASCPSPRSGSAAAPSRWS